MKVQLKFNNLLDNYDEFLKRLDLFDLSLESYEKEYLYSHKEKGEIHTVSIIGLLSKFEALAPILDYSEDEKVKLATFLKTQKNKYLVVNKLKEEWNYQTKSGIILNPQTSDPYLGESPKVVAQAKKKYLSEIKKFILYHATKDDKVASIAKEGLVNDYNYFSTGVRDAYHNISTYGLIGVNASDVLDRLYPDPEYFPGSIEFEGRNYSGYIGNFEDAGVNLDVLYLAHYQYDEDEGCFGWQAVKGHIKPKLIFSAEILENKEYVDDPDMAIQDW